MSTSISMPVSADAYSLPDMGSSSDSMMTRSAEARLGKLFMRSVRNALPVLDDPLATSYIESLGTALVESDPTAGGNFTFFVIDEPVVNAFAGPGGYIGVYSGLILAAETESELAAVMAHEIAHVTQRHLMRSFEDQSKLSLPTTALLIAAAVLGAQVSPDAGVAAIAGVQAAALQRRINFTRDNEKEADRIGIQTLAGAGHDPFAMAGFFERLAKATRVYESNAPEFLRTHPVTADRISDSLGRAESFGVRQRPDSLGFQLTRAKLRERSYRRAEQSVAHFEDTLRGGRFREEIAERYGYALALQRARRFTEAKRESDKLIAAHPSRAEFIVLDAELDSALGKGAEALAHLRQAVSLFPSQWPLRVAYAEALTTAGQPARALDELKAVARVRPANAMLYEMIVLAATQAGDQTSVDRYRAEKLYVEGDLEPAIRHLELALRRRDVPYHDAAQIQVRLDAWREEERDEKKRGGNPLRAAPLSLR
ncbi:beta-barrel assembly-enhancing protease [Thiocapsa bogorovii]|uniref:beta-barrel assembly-enhancing protease n=1 Tax=Thiocapsa bogorovii TaxID=521689 RepID=UPI001E424F45|nr:M48 family metalloprotease [Thiocapsa bogorovii]UHD14790.1 M48 family metalloprotease [Thiocapsa bogorovii]